MRKSILLLFLGICSFSSYGTNPTTFAEAEHASAGNQIQIHLNAIDPAESAHVFQLPNGVHANYGEIVTFGDVYGIPDKAISQGTTEMERRQRFMEAFQMFAFDLTIVTETNQILAAIHDEQTLIEQALKEGKSPQEAYRQQKNETARRFNCITGGGCDQKSWWLKPGRYLTLAKNDYDHFGQHAWIAYRTGHALAIEQAIQARQMHDHKKLELAYAMNAFASHFLSDRFSTGHIRTPRVELPEQVSPSLLGTILVHYMHNEENLYGLHVKNRIGEEWLAYGDQMYFAKEASTHREMIRHALQISADQIFIAYLEGKAPNQDLIYDLLPNAQEDSLNSHLDIVPMFYWDAHKQKLLRRADLSNVFDRHFTTEWWGWSTLSLLIQLNGELPGLVQSELAHSKYGLKALKEGFITHQTLIDYLGAKKNKSI